ncbi:hypothetical protein Mal52_38320 [Symmachiella dynata]|uniref:NRDE family protein n=1 Tax=Symmachiella dynata TaxID=2527995 RepID=A0A517ZS79_9PLAN|nr:NRDE family protein [Symmachiella dynata]QDU45338.1 hypothetical protein Mal52_38320 [Symmachiella dynata]
MCLLGVAFKTIPQHPVFLLANREESPLRQSSEPAIIHEQTGKSNWLGGTDLQAGGTWLGVNQQHMIVAVTNRQKQQIPKTPRSRGLLCRDLLGFPDIATASAHAQKQLQTGNYAGCNFLLAAPDAAVSIEAGDKFRITPLPPGIHLMANSDLNDPLDPRIHRVRLLLEGIDSQLAEDWIAAAKKICGLTGEGSEPAICRTGSDWGTVSSSIIVLADSANQSTFLHAAGPPSSTPYNDFSNMFQQL